MKDWHSAQVKHSTWHLNLLSADLLLVIVKIKELLEVEIKVRNCLPYLFRKMFIWDDSNGRSDKKFFMKGIWGNKTPSNKKKWIYTCY